METPEILDDIGIKYTDINTHWLLRTCPCCSGNNKLRVDKESGLWICFKCRAQDESEGAGNLWKLLSVHGLEDYEIREYLGRSQSIVFSDDFRFTAIESDNDTPKEEEKLKQLTMPYHFYPLECDQISYNRFPQAYNYLLTRKVSSFALIEHYNLHYSPIQQRLIFPFYDLEDRLIGWQGRDITNRSKLDHPKCQNKDCPTKYKYYFIGESKFKSICPSCGGDLEKTAYPKTMTSFDFKKQQVLINENIIDWSRPVTLVEGPFDSINTPNSIPLLGKTLSVKQLAILVKKAKEVILYFDGDKAGDVTTKLVYQDLDVFFTRVSIVLNNPHEDPGQFNYEENINRLKNSIKLHKWADEKKIMIKS